MSEQGKANYEGFHAAIPGSSPVPFGELPHVERLHWDAGATSVELWLSEQPVDEDMPGNEPEAAKVIVVERDGHPARRFRASGWQVADGGVERGDLELTDADGDVVVQIGSRLWDVVYGASAVPSGSEDLLGQLIDCGNENDQLRALLGVAVRELADSGSPQQNALAAELARDGGIEL